MKQVFYNPGGGLIVRDVPPPALTDGSVLVANAYSVISAGTERNAVRLGTESLWRKALRRPQLVQQFRDKLKRDGLGAALGKVRERTAELKALGYSSAGQIIAVGRAVSDLAPGQRVACAGAGYAHHAEIIAVPRNLVVPIPAKVTLEAAAFTTIGSVAMQGLRRAQAHFGETVVVLGLGLVGLLAVQIGRAAGYRIIGLDIDEERVPLARQLGAEASFNSAADNVVEQIMALSDGFGVDVVIVYAATPSSEPVNLAFDLCRQRGRVVAVGSFGMDLDRERMYRKELDFAMSTSYGPGRYDPLYEESGIDYPIGYVRWTENRNGQAFLAQLASGQVDVRPLISGRFPIERAPEAYAQLECDTRPLTFLLTYEPDTHQSVTPLSQETRSWQVGPLPRPVGVAVLGAGAFVREKHLPALKAQPADYRIAVIVTAHGEKAVSIAEQYGASLATTDHREALASSEGHLALIGTRHDLHVPLILDALAAGLPIFCEKPLCLTPEELEEIQTAVTETGLPLWLGLNRRYSPLAIALKQALDGLRRPAQITYRVNAGFLPAGHWTQDPTVGGGRLVGEGCHFLDFFHFLLDRPDALVTPVEVMGAAIPPGDGVVARDDFSLSVRYDDGSLATLVYTALGHPDLPKERIEVHAAGVSLVLDDFVSLTGHGVALAGASRGNTLRLDRQDKGVAQQWREIAKALHEEPNEAITFDAIYRTMRLTFWADRVLRGDCARWADE